MQKKQDFYLICVASGGNQNLPFFVHYYRTLGFNKFIFLNNGTMDGFYTKLSKDKNFIIVEKKDNYKNHPTWVNEALKQYVSVGSWCLIADSDEYLVFPGYEKHPISYLVNFLERNNYDCISAILLDVYSDRPISQVQLDYKVSPMNFLNWFDVETNELRNTKYFGGARKRVFGVVPLITKYPFFRRKADITILPGNHDTNSKNVFYKSTALLHAKYDNTFHKKYVKHPFL